MKTRWDLFSYEELVVISAALPKDALRGTDVSLTLQRELEREQFERRAEALPRADEIGETEVRGEAERARRLNEEMT
jgi:hypothetical protein